MMSVTEIFRSVSIIAGILIGLFAYRIYVLTKGGSKGWKYLTIAGMSLSIWASLQVIFMFILPIKLVRVIAGMFLFPLMAFFSPIATTTLLKDMKIKKPKWFTQKNMIYYFSLASVLLLIYNILTPFNDFLAEILSIVHTLIPVSFILLVLGSYFIGKGTKQRAWMLISAGSIALIVGTALISYTGNCCGNSAGLKLCEGYVYDYVPSTPLPCVASILPVALNGAAFQLAGILLYCDAFLRIWKPMEFT
jgi:hypothetical protein